MELSLNFPAKRGKHATHVSMRGGIHYVPPDRENEFFSTYIRCIKEGSKLYLVEQCNTNEFKFFMDIDYKAEKALTVPDVMALSKKITKIVDGGKCLVLISNPKQVGDKIKSGIHLIWFEYIVDLDEAYKIRENVLKDMEPGHDWENILDKAVYRGGLRMPWSNKYNKKTGQDEISYLPLCIITENQGVREVSHSPDETILKLASVRISTSGKREGKFTQNQVENSVSNINGKFGDLERFIRQFIPGQRRTVVRNIMKQGEENIFIIDVNSRYCENKGGIHSGNRIYFVVNKKAELTQRCFCKCDISRRKGFCNNFRGKAYKLPSPLWKKLLE